jgi:hypothetical protein
MDPNYVYNESTGTFSGPGLKSASESKKNGSESKKNGSASKKNGSASASKPKGSANKKKRTPQWRTSRGHKNFNPNRTNSVKQRPYNIPFGASGKQHPRQMPLGINPIPENTPSSINNELNLLEVQRALNEAEAKAREAKARTEAKARQAKEHNEAQARIQVEAQKVSNDVQKLLSEIKNLSNPTTLEKINERAKQNGQRRLEQLTENRIKAKSSATHKTSARKNKENENAKKAIENAKKAIENAKKANENAKAKEFILFELAKQKLNNRIKQEEHVPGLENILKKMSEGNKWNN